MKNVYMLLQTYFLLHSQHPKQKRTKYGQVLRKNGLKLKPFIVFKNAKLEINTLTDEFKTPCVINTSSNGWMKNNLTTEYTKKNLGTFTFGRRFLAWDSCRSHMDRNIAASLTSSNIDEAIIPGGCKKFIQAPDVSWN